MSAPASASPPPHPFGGALALQRAEELLATLPGVISARIVAGDTGTIDEIHLLTSQDVAAKQTVRNVESALIAHLGLRVDHRKISVATSTETVRRLTPVDGGAAGPRGRGAGQGGGGEGGGTRPGLSVVGATSEDSGHSGRRVYFEDVEVRRSRAKGVLCRVTLRRGEASFIGEAEGLESDRSRVELAARAALSALVEAEGLMAGLALDGVKRVPAFEREFVFVAVSARQARASVMLTGSCEVKDSPETAAVLAVLDATNRWIANAG